MKQRKVGFSYKNNRLEIDLNVCEGFEKVSGLMFKKKEETSALLFEFDKLGRIGIHSFFVFFPFIAIWLDDKNKVVELKIVKPFSWRVVPKKDYQRLIEIPINSKYSNVIALLNL